MCIDLLAREACFTGLLYSALERQKKPNKWWESDDFVFSLSSTASVLQNGCNLTPHLTLISVKTYDSYAAQHQAFVNHAEKTITGLEQQIKDAEAKIEAAEKQVTI